MITKKFLLITLSVIVGAILFSMYSACRNGAEYHRFVSPDGRFKIVVFQTRQVFGMMPGQSGDAPGYVCLYEIATEKLLERKKVEMVQRIHQITWSATNADIKLFADWKLPQR